MLRVFEQQGHKVKPLPRRKLETLLTDFREANEYLAYLYVAAATTLEKDLDTLDYGILKNLKGIQCSGMDEVQIASEFFQCVLKTSGGEPAVKWDLQWKSDVLKDQKSSERPWFCAKDFMKKFDETPELRELAKTPYM